MHMHSILEHIFVHVKIQKQFENSHMSQPNKEYHKEHAHWVSGREGEKWLAKSSKTKNDQQKDEYMWTDSELELLLLLKQVTVGYSPGS